MANTLRKEIADFLNSRLGEYSETRRHIDEYDLAERLESRGYCTEPYRDYEQALSCPINKRKEHDCRAVSCPHHRFCSVLRKEGYIA